MRILSLSLLLLAGTASCSVPDKFLSDAGGGDVTLTVTSSGDSDGTVSSSPAGIDCGSSCTLTVPAGTVVTLTANADANTTFDGWSGGSCGGTGDCEITLNADTTIDAEFNLERRTLTVTKTGNGTGGVTSDPTGINCGADCDEDYAHGTSVTLTAAPDVGSTFLGWTGGGCTGVSPCTVDVDADIAVQAAFALDNSVVVTLAGNGTGGVTSNPPGIDCGSDCSEAYGPGMTVVLTALATGDSTFTGWTGGGCGGVGTCTVSTDTSVNVTATFTLNQHTLSVTTSGTGTGSVSSNPIGIDCGVDCDQDYDSGTDVLLTATPIIGRFSGWSGGGCGGVGTCTVDVTADTTVNAAFTQITVTNVTSSTTNGAYGVGAAISIQVTFTDAVTVTGTPLLALNTGASASYTSGSGTNTLTFSYTVAVGQTSFDLDYAAVGSLTLGGGTITGPGTATLTLPTPGAAGSLGANKALVVDTTGPIVTSVNSTTTNGTYGVAAAISIQINFNEAVTVTGTPTLALNTGATATYASGSGTTQLTFSYTTAAGQNTGDLDYAATTSLALAGGTIRDGVLNNATLTLPAPGAAGSLGANKALVIDSAGPVVTSVTSSTANGAYNVPDVISIQVVFNEAATVTGTPRITLNTGAVVNYSSGSGTTSLTFAYTVAAAQNTADLDYSATTSLALNGGTIRDSVLNNATLTLPTPGAAGSLGANKNIVVDTIAPTVTFSNVPAHSTHDNGTLMWVGSETITVSSCTLDAVNQGCAAASTQFTFDRVSNATHTFQLNFSDAAGNTGTNSHVWLVMVPRYPNAMGATYTTESMVKQTNALRACESHWGVGLCASDGCGSCNNRGYHRAGTPNCNGSTYWNYADVTQDMGCFWSDPAEILVSYDNLTWQQAYTTGVGAGTYTPLTTNTKQQNALRACEAVHGVGLCATDACGSCNNKGYHRSGTPNCNGSVYWNYFDTTQDMSCFWTDPNEIIVSFDGGMNWVQQPSNAFGSSYAGSTTNVQTNALRACESVWGAGNCANDGCGSCDLRGYHRAGAPNCNGSFYWNYTDDDQFLSCGWVSPYEILISPDNFDYGQAPLAMWDPAWSLAGVTYSNGNLSISGNSAGTKNARTTIGKSSGKYYWEVTAIGGVATTNHGGIGILESVMPNNAAYIGFVPSGLSFGYADGSYYFNWASLTVPSGTAAPASAAITTNNIYMFALDMDAKLFWAGQGGTWYNGGNPAAGTAPLAAVLSGTVFPGVTFYANSGNAFRANFGQTGFTYTVPAGFQRGFY